MPKALIKKGTSVTVEDLFFNTPARLKFLKKASTELGYIADTVEKIVLANPSLRITLESEKGVVLEHAGGDLRDAIASVYPNLDISRFIAADRTASSGVRVTGYISEVDYTSPTRSRQTVIVNGRVVSSDTVSAAVDKAYADFLVKRTYPMYVLDVVVPFEEVDVNVHPAKSEVRFRNKNAVFGAVFRAVDEALKGAFCETKHGFAPRTAASDAAFPAYEQQALDTAALYAPQGTYSPYGEVDTAAPTGGISRADEPFDLSSLRGFGGVSHTPVIRRNNVAQNAVGAYSDELSRGLAAEDRYMFAFSETDDEDLANSLNNRFRLFDGAVVGQVFDTYLIVERANVVYVIDQHAAHERILFDKLSASLSSEYSQTLLIPHTLRLSGAEGEYFEKMMPVLNGMGFSIEKNAGNFIVYAVPEPVVRMDFNRFLAELFSHMLDDGELKLADLVKEVVCRDACRAAIKGGEHLTKRQIEFVLSNLIDKNGDLPQKCPHGRPAVVALTKRDFEKMFLRIV